MPQSAMGRQNIRHSKTPRGAIGGNRKSRAQFMNMQKIGALQLAVDLAKKFCRPKKPLAKCKAIGNIAVINDLDAIDNTVAVADLTHRQARFTGAVGREHLYAVSPLHESARKFIGAARLPTVLPGRIKV